MDVAALVADTAPAIGCGALSACAAWLVSGCDARSMSDALALLRGRALPLGRLWAVGASALRGLSGLPRPPGREVGLGDVSEMIDIVRLGLSAGLSFDAALKLYCGGRAGLLPDKLERALLSWQTGASRRTAALLDVARSLEIRPLEAFAIAVGQALELGAPLSDTLANQSREIRATYKADVERRIEKAPVKLLIPTGTLILPALLLSIVGPLLAASGLVQGG